MALLISDEPVPLRSDDGGTVRIGNTRVSLDSIVSDFEKGATAEQIALDFPTVNLADIYAVIAYYLRHRDEVERYLTERDAQAAETRKRIEPVLADQGIRERLLARRDEQQGNHAATLGG